MKPPVDNNEHKVKPGGDVADLFPDRNSLEPIVNDGILAQFALLHQYCLPAASFKPEEDSQDHDYDGRSALNHH